MSPPLLPPKPPARPGRVSLWRYVKLFRRDLLSAQPAKLYRAWMAEFKTPFFRSYLVNQPELVDLVLKRRPRDFPKSNRVSEGLRPLLGNSVFLTNGAEWERQRRIIDPAFEGGASARGLSCNFSRCRGGGGASCTQGQRHPGGDRGGDQLCRCGCDLSDVVLYSD